MRRGALLFILVERPSGIACSATAVLSHSATTHILRRVPPSRYAEQARGKTSVLVMQHIFKLRGRLLYISARAAFAASAGSYVFPGPVESHRGPQCDSERLGSSRPVTRVASVASSSGVGRTSTTSRRWFHARSLVETSEAPATVPEALKAWTWKTPQGILVSPLDRRHYRWLVLPNGLQVMVINDPNAVKAAAAMSVGVGAASDPRELPGLAHFLEHMLFLGTSKYPLENAYKSFLSKHGGGSNASTSMDATTYKFQVGEEHLREALDIFAQFFISPLFSESSTERELLAVDSEDSKNRINDGRRILQVLKALANPDHPYSKFSTGNAKTLRDDVSEGIDTRRELLSFHEKHYHPGNMALVLLGKEDLDVLEEWARTSFAEVQVSPVDASSSTKPTEATVTEEVEVGKEPDSEASGIIGKCSIADEVCEAMRSPWQTPPAVMVDMEPLKELRRLLIQWPMPPVLSLWRNSPTRVLGHVMAHEGPGSLFAALQDQGLANSLIAGTTKAYDDFSLFQVDIGLTEEGEKRWSDVVALVHACARQVRELPPDEVQRIWKETRDMSAIYLRFQQEPSPYNLAASLSRRLQLYPFQEALSAGAVVDPEVDPALFQAFADYLRPENTLTWRIWKRKPERGVDTQDETVNEGTTAGCGEQESSPLLQERWYGVKYRATPTPEELLQAWNTPNDVVDASLSIPGPNKFIPDDFSLVCERSTEKGSGFDGGSIRKGSPGDSTAESGVLGEGTTVVEPRKGVLEAPDLIRLDTAEDGCIEGLGKHGHLWHRLDKSFRQPRAYVRVVLGTPVVRDGGSQASEHAAIMSDVLSKVLAQRTYDASLAGLDWDVTTHACGYLIEVSGFSQKIEPLLEGVLQAFLDPEAAAGGPEAFAKHFELAKDKAIRHAKSWAMRRPDNIASYYMNKAIMFPRDDVLDPGCVKAAEAATLEGCLSLHRESISRIFPLGLVYGNASPDDARRTWRMIMEKLDGMGCQVLPEEDYPRSLVGMLPAGKQVNIRVNVPNQEDENSAAIVYWQLGDRDERKYATLVLLSQMMREPCFTELRTKQQIGYIVSSGLQCSGRGSRQLGFSVTALSKSMGPDEICERVDAFLPCFREMLTNMTQEEFDTHVRCLIERKLEPPKKAVDEYKRLRDEIFTGDLKWDRAAAMAETLASITREDILDLLDTGMLAADTSKRMSVLLYGKDRPCKDTKEDERTIELVPETLLEFTASLPMRDTTITPQQAVAGAGS